MLYGASGYYGSRAGARYVSPFIGRFDDISEDGLDQVANIVSALGNYDFTENTVNGEQIEVMLHQSVAQIMLLRQL